MHLQTLIVGYVQKLGRNTVSFTLKTSSDNYWTHKYLLILLNISTLRIFSSPVPFWVSGRLSPWVFPLQLE